MTSIRTSTNAETIISELLYTGRRFNTDPDHTKYVCHTSSIPLCTTVDNQRLLRDWTDTVELTHSIKNQPGYEEGIDYRCCRKHCMFVGRNITEQEILKDNCPCGNITRLVHLPDGEEIEVGLQPLCFLQVVKELRYKFGYTDASVCLSGDECCHNDGQHIRDRTNRPKIDFDEIMFCQDGVAVTDSSYPRFLREEVGFSGWEYANTPEKISSVLNQLYWFRKFVDDSTRTYMSQRCHELKAKAFRKVLEQVLYTINGVISKKLLCFPCEMENYRNLAYRTAKLFGALVRDYFRRPQETDIDTSRSLFMIIKSDFNWVKSNFPSDNRDVRSSVLTYFNGRKDEHARFWSHAFKRLALRSFETEDDYTNSPAFIFTMSGFCQTRNLGYLPQWVAEVKRRDFRKIIGREREEISRDDAVLIQKLVIRQAKKAGIEPYFLKNAGSKPTLDFKEVLTHLKIPLKPSASINHTVSEGGKVEDARELFLDACRNQWEIPIRSFEDGSIQEIIYFSDEIRKNPPGYQGHLFWVSLQVLINSLHEREPNLFKLEYRPLKNSKLWLDQMFKMNIVHISEPGKERNLTKTSSILAWVLTVASKISQGVLSFSQDHRAGLILSAQDWMHQRRISAESFESEWMYDQNTRKRREVWNGFQDWTQSTDFIPRRVGYVALRAWFAYIAMPDWFGKLVRWTTLQNYTVSEVSQPMFGWGDKVEPVIYNGFVNEGWMMSMPLTKTVLHLMHDVNVGLVESIMEKYGCVFAERPTTERRDLERSSLGAFYIDPNV